MSLFDPGFFFKTLLACLAGVPTTLAIAFVSLIAASPLAFGMAIARMKKTPVASQLSSFYISFVQGTPAVVQILIIYSVTPSLIAAAFRAMGSSFNVFDLNPIVYAFVIFTISSAAVLSEAFRSAILSVDSGQLEAALVSGLSTTQAWVRIIAPQAFVLALPNLCNVTVNTIKNTSLVFLMSVQDITAVAKIQAAYGYNYIEAYLDIWIIYVALGALIEYAFKAAEKHLKVFRGQPSAAAIKEEENEEKKALAEYN